MCGWVRVHSQTLHWGCWCILHKYSYDVTALEKQKFKKRHILFGQKWRSLSLVDITPLSCLHVNCWLSSSLPAFCLSPYARPLIFAVCSLLVGCQDSAWECHCTVCHLSSEWKKEVVTCRSSSLPCPCSAAHGSTTTTHSSSSSSLAEGGCD